MSTKPYETDADKLCRIAKEFLKYASEETMVALILALAETIPSMANGAAKPPPKEMNGADVIFQFTANVAAFHQLIRQGKPIPLNKDGGDGIAEPGVRAVRAVFAAMAQIAKEEVARKPEGTEEAADKEASELISRVMRAEPPAA